MFQIKELENQNIRHAFFTRRGGVSKGIYESLNCGFGSKDDPNLVIENRARCMAALGLPSHILATCYQHHSSDVAIISDEALPDSPPKADALVTSNPTIALGILTADCGPVLFSDPINKVVAAAHAGWRGALGGILTATVHQMISQGAKSENIIAALGPMIGPQSYEVGPEFPSPFLKQAAKNNLFFQDSVRVGHFMFDLPGYITSQLEKLSLSRISNLGYDTYTGASNFFSYRRSYHKAEGDYGRMLSTIAII